MPKKNVLETYQAALADNDRSRLLQARKIKAEIRNDSRLDLLTRAVLGITGSSVELVKAKELEEKVDALQGQPIVILEQVNEDHKVLAAQAAIINGRLAVDNRFEDKEEAAGSGHVFLGVPVDGDVAAQYSTGKLWYPGQFRLWPVNQLLVKRYVLQEWSNRTVEPDDDWREVETGHQVLLGKEQIYGHPSFPYGIGKMLLRLEELAENVALRGSDPAAKTI
ncbi:MAG TPA: hypothetical protein VLG13_02655 [Patescibacteria group bacterium]|nr:hypothetical protein [Patescibacteria group bacterium]